MLYDFETTWKKYAGTLQEQFGPRVSVAFAPCNVIAPLSDEQNRRVDIADTHLLLFFYVCHETSGLHKTAGLPFYAEVARQAAPGSLVVFADVQTHSAAHLARVVAAMAAQRAVEQLPTTRRHAAEVVILRFGERKVV